MQKKLLIAYMVLAGLAVTGMAASTAVGYRWFGTGSSVSTQKPVHKPGHGGSGGVVIFHK